MRTSPTPVNIVKQLSAADDALKRRLRYHLLLRVVFLSLLLGVSLLLEIKGHDLPFPPTAYVLYFIVGIYIFTIVSALILSRIGRFAAFAYLQLLFDTFLTAALVFFTGSSRSIFTIIYFFPIITASFLLFRRGGMFIAAVCTLSYGFILAGEFLRFSFWLSVAPWQEPISDKMVGLHYFSLHGATFFLVSALSSVISEKLRTAEAALSKTAESYDRLSQLYKQIFDDIGTGIITVDDLGTITSFNPAAEDITGYRLNEVAGQKIAGRFPGLEVKTPQFLRPVIDLTRKDGNRIPVGYSWARLNTPGGRENIVFTMQDLSQIKKMEEQVRQAEKMAAIGGMAAGIAHEFRNPLASISGAAQFLRLEFENTSADIREKLMTIIIRECDRLDKTVGEFLQFSRPTVPNRKWFFLKEVADEVVLQIRQIQGRRPDCGIAVDIPEKLDCWADPQLIKQVLFNLVENGANAMENAGGQVLISAGENKHGNPHTLLQITDNGRGIPPELRDKIFEPFFTTRENGTGLGLAIVRQIIENHGGSILIRPAADQPGTTVYVVLPLPAEQEEADDPQPPRDQPSTLSTV